MEDTNLSTDVSSAALTPAAEPGSLSTGAATPGGDGLAQVAQTALDQATGQPAAAQTDPIATALSAIPANDDDLASVTDMQQRQLLTGLRGQLRVIGDAYRELEPLRVFEPFGDPKAVQTRLQIANLLYTPVKGPNGQPVRDPNTQTIRITTKPFVEHIDKVSPGLPEQLLVDLLALETENETGVKEPLLNQVFRFYKLDINRLPQYQNIDAHIARSTGTITPEELAEIPSEYHAAYRTVPASIRAAWASLDPADQTRLLEDYKGKLDDAAYKEEQRTQALQRQEAERIAYANHVAAKQEEYLGTVRRERTDSLITHLSQQITFSTDPATNKVMIGTLAGSLAQLLDPDWRFVAEEQVLAPLGLKLDHTFDAALESFNTNAGNAVAARLAGDEGQAGPAFEEAVKAANQLMAKLAIFALAVAKRQGATVVERAAQQAGNLAAAAAARPGMPNAQVAQTNGRLLPDNMRPGSDEAARFLAEQTGLFQPATG